jgi:DNA-binding transcriptional regulator YhcF (GntR family)
MTFYIPISNGILTKSHRNKIGIAIWEFMWLIDRITRIKGEEGFVLGGKPINLEDMAKDLGLSGKTLSRNLHKLEKESYIKTRRTPYGIVFNVLKAKKIFNKRTDTSVQRSDIFSQRTDTSVRCNIRQDNDKTMTRQYVTAVLNKLHKRTDDSCKINGFKSFNEIIYGQ